ncbi:aspartate/glutamate racemase family protein [Salegentibacter chungangensis]|uniref:Aspartate/glutamate racemase family protein n=1 Tax=Salegentibacter chungangensis TaxID=1335724 RepID=A0ABW3NVD5_9FLAO
MKTLGMIGGTSWHSTIEYYRMINENVGKKIGSQGNPPLIIHSLNVELMRRGDWNEINKTYLETSQKLENAGAEAIVICANTPHLVYEFVQPKIGVPILHVADAAGKEAERLQLSKLGLLGTKPVMTKGFIQDRLKSNFNIETIIPEPEYREETHKYISEELTRGVFSEGAKKFYLDQIQILKENGAEGIILGCTELPMLLKQEDTDVPLLATTDLHAQMAADFILS